METKHRAKRDSSGGPEDTQLSVISPCFWTAFCVMWLFHPLKVVFKNKQKQKRPDSSEVAPEMKQGLKHWSISSICELGYIIISSDSAQVSLNVQKRITHSWSYMCWQVEVIIDQKDLMKITAALHQSAVFSKFSKNFSKDQWRFTAKHMYVVFSPNLNSSITVSTWFLLHL